MDDRTYIKKEREVIDQVILVWEVSNGDAQGIVEAAKEEVRSMINRGLAARDIAASL